MKTNLVAALSRDFVFIALVIMVAMLGYTSPAQAERLSLSGLKNQIDSVGGDVDAVQAQADQNTADISTRQKRISGVCPPEQSIAAINVDGSVICEVDTDTDTDTTYSAGTGLSLRGTTFAIEPKAAFRNRMSADQAVPWNTDTYLNFNFELYDVGGGFDPSTNRFTAPEAGIYHFTCSVLTGTSIASGNVRLYIGSDMVQIYGPRPAFETITISTDQRLFAGQTVGCYLYQNANGGVGTISIARNFSRFSGFRVD